MQQQHEAEGKYRVSRKDFQALKPTRPQPPARLPKPGGGFTVSINGMHEITMDGWMTVFNRFVDMGILTLGAWIEFSGKHELGTQLERYEKAMVTTESVSFLPIPAPERRVVLGTTSLVQGLYGAQVTDLSVRNLTTWSAAAICCG